MFGVFFVLGFALYAALYAGAAALVSRTEDINQIVAPLTLVAAAGYLVAVYSSTGLIDPSSTFVVVMSYVPFFSPYPDALSPGCRVVGPVEVAVAVAILAVSVPVAIWWPRASTPPASSCTASAPASASWFGCFGVARSAPRSRVARCGRA